MFAGQVIKGRRGRPLRILQGTELQYLVEDVFTKERYSIGKEYAEIRLKLHGFVPMVECPECGDAFSLEDTDDYLCGFCRN